VTLNLENTLVTIDEGAREYLKMAYDVAWNESQDKMTKNGAVIVKGTYDIFNHKFIIIYGVNHPTPGIIDLPEWSERPLKYDGMVHAEIDAITKAARLGLAIDKSIMFMPWIPCTKCYLAIKNSGINTLVAHEDIVLMSPPHWEEDLNKTLFLAERDGFEIVLYTGKIGGVKSLFNGKVWEP